MASGVLFTGWLAAVTGGPDLLAGELQEGMEGNREGPIDLGFGSCPAPVSSALTTANRGPAIQESATRVRARWVLPLGLLALMFLVYAGTAARNVVSLDVWSAHFGAWHLADSGSPWLDSLSPPPLEGNPLRSQFVRVAPNGHAAITRAPGVIAVGVPAYWLTGHTNMSVAPGGIMAALLTAFSALFIFLALARSLPRRQAALVAAAFGLATPVWSVAANGLWPHTLTVFGITGMAWSASRNRWWWVGVFGGVALWGRLHVAVIVALVGLLVGRERRDVGLLLRVGVGSGAFLALLCGWNHWMYGTWNPTAAYEAGLFAQYASSKGVSVSNQLGFWLAPDRGILVWTPVLVLLLPALARSWTRLPDWSRALVWAGIVYTVLQGLLDDYDGGYGFYGYRLGLEMLACATPAMALAAPAAGRVARHLIGPVLAIQLCAIAIGARGEETYLLRSPLNWHDNAFISLVSGPGAIGWGLLVMIALLGAWGGRLWEEHDDVPHPLTVAVPRAPTRYRTSRWSP